MNEGQPSTAPSVSTVQHKSKIKKFELSPNHLAILALVTAISISVFSATYSLKTFWDDDIYFLLNTGRDILQNGFTRIEPFTIHSNFTYLSQQWLTSVIDWKLFEIGGPVLLQVFYLLLWGLIAFVAYRVAIKATKGRTIFSCIIVSVFFIVMAPFIKVNPRGFDFLILFLSYLVIEKYIATKNKKILLLFPLFELLIINLHGTMWVLPFFIPAVTLFNKQLNKSDKELLGIIILLMLPCTLLNPYGTDMVVYIFNSLFGSTLDLLGILELKPMDITVTSGWTLYILLIIFLYRLIKQPRAVPVSYTILLIITVFMGLSALRNIALFYTIAVIWFASAFAEYDFDARPSIQRIKRLNFGYTLPTFLTAITIITGVQIFIQTTDKATIEHNDSSVYELTQILNTQENIVPAQTKLYTHLNDGSFLEFYGYPSYIDARAEIFSKSINGKKDIISEFMLLQNGITPINEFLNIYNFDYLALNNVDRLFYCQKEIENSGYSLIWEDDDRKLYKQNSLNQ